MVTRSSRAGAPLPIMKSPTSEEKLILLLLTRLERISADSYWAHRASGVRGALLKVLEKMENGSQNSNSDILIAKGFEILKEAAKEKAR
jgi:hypothetical protein